MCLAAAEKTYYLKGIAHIYNLGIITIFVDYLKIFFHCKHFPCNITLFDKIAYCRIFFYFHNIAVDGNFYFLHNLPP